MSETPIVRIASANLELGGVSEAGDADRLGKTLALLREWAPDAVLLQEVTARAAESVTGPLWGKIHDEQARVGGERATEADSATIDHLAALAGELGMIPVLGPPVPLMFRRMHTAILIGKRLELVAAGPPMPVSGTVSPAWTEAIVRVRGVRHVLGLYSLHMPARSAAMQLIQAEWLASHVAQQGRLTIAGGDWNCLSRADDVPGEALRAMKPHLRTARMKREGGQLTADYSVEDVFSAIGMRDAAACLPEGRREPRELSPTGAAGSRVDRFAVSGEAVPALRGYRQRATSGSDHHAISISVDRTALDEAIPPGYRP